MVTSPGALRVGGASLARGYLNAPELTAAKFVPDHVGSAAGGRLCRTGDLVRWRPAGLEYLGRLDRQLKLRGFRIEAGEIDPSFVVTHVFPLEEAPEAYEIFKYKKDGCVKVVLKP